MAAEMEAKGFEHMGLDGRLLRAVAELGWAVPTAIQARAIPLAMEGRDLLARARTGSGKTGAYGLPLLHKLLAIKEASPAVPQAVRALVLVPSAELARQVGHTLRRLAAFCSRQLRVAELCGHSDLADQRPVLMEQPDIVVGTPGRVLAHVAGHSLALRPWLELLVLDEADLLLSFGFGDDIRALLCHLPKIYQALLVSATLNPELEALQELVLHNPVQVVPPEPRLPGSSQLQQFQLRCGTEEDKFLLLAALLKLRLLRGRALLFVGSLARAFRVKLFLEQFGIAACALNPQLPARSRCHVIAQFNRGLYDYIVATDEEGPAEPPRHRPRRGGTARKADKKDKKGDKKGQPPQCPQDPEFGVSRGIDFQNVAAVINFDVPNSVETYIHRVGRTARGDSPGTALTLALPDELEGLRHIEDTLAAENGQSMLQPYEFRMEEIETLRYRCRDAMRAVTKQAVREARLRELRQELLNSEKLKVYFEDNPRDLQALRHDRPLHPANVQPHLGHVPEYLVPPSLRGIADPNLKKRKCPRGAGARRGGKKPRGSGNPLQSFRFARRGNKRGAAGTP
ncbi:probable ATP-dependent RNA helicase DDX56 isoform X1 [Haemorhous mexicanus]|uniref:probable ATP-dependent RNA helicase DDX56 isoform X1 n=1 Tax=Haemorhous mexicanus TaxID=30427 RepID=UPI0028BDEBAB|nr:probable ATP-dependent RNA helicase DDX56 isoform X1 [Haemorhous mexicanus]